MAIYFLRRLALTIPTFVALMFLTFLAIRLVPGDPVEVRVGEHGISPERLAFFRHELGLDQPVWKQFLDYAWKLLHGDFGMSLSTNQKVLTEFLTLFPATIELSFFAMAFAVLVGVPAGAAAAGAERQDLEFSLPRDGRRPPLPPPRPRVPPRPLEPPKGRPRPAVVCEPAPLGWNKRLARRGQTGPTGTPSLVRCLSCLQSRIAVATFSSHDARGLNPSWTAAILRSHDSRKQS